MLTIVTFALAGAAWLYVVIGAIRTPDPRLPVRWATWALLAAAPLVAIIGLLVARHS